VYELRAGDSARERGVAELHALRARPLFRSFRGLIFVGVQKLHGGHVL